MLISFLAVLFTSCNADVVEKLLSGGEKKYSAVITTSGFEDDSFNGTFYLIGGSEECNDTHLSRYKVYRDEACTEVVQVFDDFDYALEMILTPSGDELYKVTFVNESFFVSESTFDNSQITPIDYYSGEIDFKAGDEISGTREYGMPTSFHIEFLDDLTLTCSVMEIPPP